MIIGAIANIGIVCEVIIQGIKVISHVLEYTIATAKIIPSKLPITKPNKVEESVIPAW